MKTTSEDKSHAKLSPSGAERWLNCPASVSFCKDLPDLPESEAAREGTLAHAVLEQRVLRRFFNKVVKLKDPKQTPTPAMLKHADFVLDYLEKNFDAGDSQHELLVETKADMSHIDSDFWGTLDLAIVREFEKLTVIDYKYGSGKIVEPVEKKDGRASLNPQLMSYACGIAKKYDFNFAEVELVIIQPRAKHSGGAIRSHTIDMGELIAFQDLLIKGAKRTRDRNPRFYTGDWCRWCKGLSTCPKHHEDQNKAAGKSFEENLPAVQETKLSPGVMTPQKIATVLDQQEGLKLLFKAVEDEAVKRLEAGERIPGWTLIPKKPIRRWNKVDAVTKEAALKFGAKKVMDVTLKSPAQLEKLGEVAADFVRKHSTFVSGGVRLGRDLANEKARDVFDDNFSDESSSEF